MIIKNKIMNVLDLYWYLFYRFLFILVKREEQCQVGGNISNMRSFQFDDRLFYKHIFISIQLSSFYKILVQWNNNNHFHFNGSHFNRIFLWCKESIY